MNSQRDLFKRGYIISFFVWIGLVLMSNVCMAEEATYIDNWTGRLAAEMRLFARQPSFAETYRHNLSLVLEPELYLEWDGGNQGFAFVPFLRLDEHDNERSHFDIRELNWLKVQQDWELRVGIGKVFWGVTESQHLVDIINQTDMVENPDGEDKLGQPMINLAIINSWGTIDFFLLPGFRERTFPGQDDRLGTAYPIAKAQTVYESERKQGHIDYAMRWYHSVKGWDIGAAHFFGTSREPQLLPAMDGGGNPVLIPFYALIDQTSLDVQGADGALLWKLELINRGSREERFTAGTGGFEYTASSIIGSPASMGLIAEYLFDERGSSAATPFANDLMVGLRLDLNNVQSTEGLFGVIQDLSSQARIFSIEAGHRLGEYWKLNLETRIYSAIPATDPLFGLHNEDYLQIELERYY